MMRAAFVALALCLTGVLADITDFERQTHHVPIDGIKPANGLLPITYYIKTNGKFKPGGPIFYGVAGRVPVEDLVAQYQIFDESSDVFNNAIVVYVEQRYFGTSKKLGSVLKTTDDLKQLTLKNVVNDHVSLIQNLSTNFNTKNFLVFGGGHGGVIAGYLARRFLDKDLVGKKYNVLGWSSSPPIKYLLRDQNTYPNVNELSTQYTTILKNVDATCLPDHLHFLFNKIRSLTSSTPADSAYANALNVLPTLTLKNTAANTDPSDDQKEFNIYLRNQLLSLAYDGVVYLDNANGDRDPNGRIQNLCTEIFSVTDATDANLPVEKFNKILAILDPNPLRWKVSDDGTGTQTPNQKLLPAVYQDCTEYQVVYCPHSANTANDPFAGSYGDGTTVDCGANTDNFAAFIKAECNLLLKGVTPQGGTVLDPNQNIPKVADYPVIMDKRVVTTINGQSLFGPSLAQFSADKDRNAANYADYFKLSHSDYWEFKKPRECEGDKTDKVRYQVLRAFGCLGNFVTDKKTKKKDFCAKDKIFDDSIADDADTYGATCKARANNDAKAKFPYGEADLAFSNTPIPPPATKPPTKPPTASTTPETVTKGANGFSSAITVLTSALLVWFATL